MTGSRNIQLKHEGQDVLDVAVLDVHPSHPHSDRAGEDREQRHEYRKHRDPRAGRDPIADHHREEDYRGDREIDQRGADRGARNRHARKIDLGYELRVADHAGAALAYRGLKELPGHQAGESKDRIGQAVGGHVGELAKQQGENHHHQQRLKHRPERAQRGRFAQLDVSQARK
jgi:hypothetical protein